MSTQALTRKQKGELISTRDIEQINPSSFFVKSQTGQSGYSVTKTGQSWACDCFDFKYRQAQCKHIFAVQKVLSEQQPTGKFKLNLWEAPV